MERNRSSRGLPREAARELSPGDGHYLAYVGPPKQYDFMGATQFRLLTTLGLREHHRLLDFGCGSLRAGRLLIPYLLPQRYFGIEPNRWLIEDAIDNQLGRDIIRIKQPAFDDNTEFRCDVFGVNFDFIVAQSIFSHTTADLALHGLCNFRKALSPGGLIACTFVMAAETRVGADTDGWIYPGCAAFAQRDVVHLFERAGLRFRRLSWFHPRQVWFIAAVEADALPGAEDLELARGMVLRDPEFAGSTKQAE